MISRNRNFIIQATREHISASTPRDSFLIDIHGLFLNVKGKFVVITNDTIEKHIELSSEAEAQIFADEIFKNIRRSNCIGKVLSALRITTFFVMIIVSLMLILNVNASIFTWNQANNHFQPSLSISTTESNISAPIENPQSQQTTAQVADTLAKGAATGDYSISFDKNTGPTLYVFADPLCVHCKNAEPMIEELERDGANVQIFPVSVISENIKESSPSIYQKTMSKLNNVLCQKGSSRTEAWKKLMSNDQMPIKSEESEALTQCEAGDIALDTNNAIYRLIKLQGTPSFIRSDGQQFPIEKNITLSSLKEWINL
ncbi:hypothetical protein ABLA30_01290 [Xenorhabdus nematophila]|uniref:hypothetical protein n=1 Tax=Xenorhabdus nematophila TaxID=628 RepID=UPI0032B7B9FA